MFSDVGAFSEQEPRWRTYATQLGQVRNRVQSPEHIDGGRDSHPSAWLQRLLRPRYRKAQHGPSLAARIGIDRIRAQCHHFNAWLQCLENLSPLRDSWTWQVVTARIGGHLTGGDLSDPSASDLRGPMQGPKVTRTSQ